MNFIRIVITIILARLLSPSDFGLLALLNVFISISETVIQGGFTSALIRKKDINDEDYSAVFIFNLGVSFCLYVVIFFSSPLIARYFQQPALSDLAKVVAFVIIIHASSIVQAISLKRAINFRATAIINFSSTVISGIISIILAFSGYGIWSLVFQIISKAVISSILLWLMGGWEFKISFNSTRFKEDFLFGFKITFADLLNVGTTESYNFIIGKLFSITSLGFFFQGKRLSSITSSIVSSVLKSVSFPVLSSLQNDQPKFNAAYLRFLRLAAFISFPMMMISVVVAKPLILLLLTEKWNDAIPFFQMISIYGMFVPLIVISGNIPLIKGRSDIYLKLTILFNGMGILILIVSHSFGIFAMVVGMIIQILINFIVNLYLVTRETGVKMVEQLKALSDIFLTSLISAIAVSSLTLLSDHGLLLMFIQVTLFLLLYVGTNYYRGSKEIHEITELISKKFNNFKSA